MSGISTHILDTSLGRPAAGIEVTLEYFGLAGFGANWNAVAHSRTDADGRCSLIASGDALKSGIYRLTFITGPYFAERKQATLYPEISITFSVLDGEAKYHIPLLVSPFGYSTYRGS